MRARRRPGRLYRWLPFMGLPRHIVFHMPSGTALDIGFEF